MDAPWSEFEELINAAEDELKGGEHEGPCDNELDFEDFGSRACSLHCDASAVREMRLSKAVDAAKIILEKLKAM